MLSIENESEFIAQLRGGDEAAFTRLVEKHHAGLMRMAMIFVSAQAAAEELVQETWLAVIDGLDRFEQRSSLKTWIFAIMANKARKRATRDARTVNLSSFDERDLERMLNPDEDRFDGREHWTRPPAPWRVDPEERLLRRQLLEVVKATIDELPARQQIVVTMRDVQGFRGAEVAEVLDISPTHQRVLLHRARGTIRAALERHLAESERI